MGVIDNGRQGRSPLLAILLAAAFGAGLLLWFPPARNGFYPRCPVHALTGLLCPGCGGTRALAALLRGHVGEALGWNALVAWAAMLLLPAGVLVAITTRLWPDRISRATFDRWQQPLATVGLAVAMLFTFWRNLR